MRSVERYLIHRVMAALTAGAFLVTLVLFLVLLHELNETFDDNLQHIAGAVVGYRQSSHPVHDGVAGAPVRLLDHDDIADVVTTTWDNSGTRIYTSDPRVEVPFSSDPGMSSPTIAGEEWVMYATRTPDGVVQVAQRKSARYTLAAQSAAKLVTPLLALALVVGWLAVFALRRGLRPLDAAAGDIAARTVRTLEAISIADVPVEITPLVVSINGLMARLSDSFAMQQRFLADAAHELRTPITALRLQLSLLKSSDDKAEQAAAIVQLAAGIARSQRLIEQLLQVARSESTGPTLLMGRVDLSELAREVVADFSLKAEARDIDLGAVADGSVPVDGDLEQLRVLLNNLVDNALRYTPTGGVVDVVATLRNRQPVLAVTDTGPGIPASEHARVFERFSRGTGASTHEREEGGSGLGLSIVRTISEGHGAQVHLSAPEGGTGLEVRITFLATAADERQGRQTFAADETAPMGRSSRAQRAAHDPSR